jgi:hypothetical protein
LSEALLSAIAIGLGFHLQNLAWKVPLIQEAGQEKNRDILLFENGIRRKKVEKVECHLFPFAQTKQNIPVLLHNISQK